MKQKVYIVYGEEEDPEYAESNFVIDICLTKEAARKVIKEEEGDWCARLYIKEFTAHD